MIMEKIQCICRMRELFKALSDLEADLIANYQVTLNEAMALCSVGQETVTASVIVERTGMTPSHASKVLRSIEAKELVIRSLGEQDKRQMYFVLSEKGRNCLEDIKRKGVRVPDLLVPLFSEGEEA